MVDQTVPQAPERPNILVIVADDLGWADVGYHGSELLTPNIDREVARSVELDQHYVSPVCSPTRTALLSGRYCSRFGITTPTNDLVYPFGTVTLASALQSVGYDTCLTGKWHLGSKPEWGPRQFGFNRSYGAFAGGVGPWDHVYKPGPFSRTWHRDDEYIEEEGHVTDLLGRQAVSYIEDKRDCPFFVYVPFTSVHTPIDEPPEWLDRNRHVYDDRRQFAATASHMDFWIGEMLKALDQTGQRDNTLVLFFSDNGGTPAGDTAKYPGVYPPNTDLGCNDPLRGHKSQVYEGGIRTPAFIQWPGVLSPGKLNAPLHVSDWMPTLTRLAGYAPERNLNWDGLDIWPVLSDETAEPGPRQLYTAGPRWNSAGLRYGDWKLVVHEPKETSDDRRVELFNLADDPCEENDRYQEEKDCLSELGNMLTEQKARDNDTVVEL